jgi:predicted transcriptional regulator
MSISLPKKISSELDEFAHATGRTKSDIVKESISAFLWESKFKGARKKLGARAKKLGLVTDDDVFKAVS